MAQKSIETMYKHTLLADAAYLDWDNNPNIAGQLRARGFTDAQAAEFLQRYQFVEEHENTANGFSAILFLDTKGTTDTSDDEQVLAIRGTEPTDLGDLIADLDLALVNGTATAQYAELKQFLGQLKADGRLNESISVAGHSLGGHLAMKLVLDDDPETQALVTVDHAYTYNAPGIGSFVLGGALTEALEFFLGASTTQPNEKITNLYGTSGPEVASGLGTLYGETVPLFIEENGFISGHLIQYVTDALSVYRILDRLEPITSQDDYTKIHGILEASNHQADQSFDNVLNVLAGLFSVDAALANKEKADEFYRELLPKLTAGEGSYTIRSLHSDNLTTLLQPAFVDDGATGIAHRYALQRLSPFVMEATNSPDTLALYASHNVDGLLDLYDASTGEGTITEQYLLDRAAFLERLLWFNGNDINPFDPGLEYSEDNHDFQNEPKYFEDVSTGYKIQQGGLFPNTHRYFFGNPTLGKDEIGSTYTGGALEDRIYGGGGRDVLEGAGGADCVYGGGGHDTYRYNSGDGFDTIFDSDGLGQIVFNDTITLSGGKQTAAGASTWYDEVNDIRYSLDTTQANGLLTITQGADSFQVRDFQSGELGITLEGYTETPFVDPNSYEAIYLAVPASATKLSVYKDQEIWGLDENDWLVLGGAGNHIVHAGSGDDVVFEDWTGDVPPPDYAGEFPVGPSNDIFYGDAGRDALEAGDGNDRLFGGTEQDLLSGMGGEDYLEGNEGDDVLSGGAGQDILKGGTGNDDLWGDATWSFEQPDPVWAVSRTGTFKVDLGFNYSADIGGTDISSNDDIDELYGGAGDDVLLGGGGDDLMLGEADQDTLFGQYGNDYLDGGAGDDHLRGDVKVGTLIDDPENRGHDLLIGGSGNDLLEGGFGDDVIFGGTNNDVLQGDFDIKPEWAGDDHLDGGQGSDELQGGLGNDTLVGGEGNDTLDGGQGDDQLEGDAGSDVYVINANDGNDVVLDRDTAPNTDRIEFGPGLTSTDARLTRLGANLVIGFANAGNSVTITNYFDSPEFEIEQIQFADGVVWTPGVITAALADVPLGQAAQLGTDQADSLTGDAGDNALSAGAGPDQLDGGLGNDTLIGGEGSDVYVINADDGNDVIVDRDANPNTDRVAFGAGLSALQARLARTGSDLVIGFADAANSVTLKNYFLGPDYEIEEISFSSGVTWMPETIKAAFSQVPEDSDLIMGPGYGATIFGDAGNNVILGGEERDYLYAQAGDDVLVGGGGDDELIGTGWDAGKDTYIGGTGNDSFFDRDVDSADTYIFNVGDGQDRLQDSGGGFDVLRFGAFITPADVYVSQNRDSGDLIVGLRGTEDKVTVEGFFNADRFTGVFTNQIERIEFDDGSAWDLPQILERIEATPGTAFDDDIHGTDAGETIDALAGNDTVLSYGGGDTVFAGEGSDFLNGGDGSDRLYGGAGDDTFIGDPGDDTLYGGEGDDIFWGEGDGDDTISGGPGNDRVLNRVGDDTYLYDLGDEGQGIEDFSGYDRLVFGSGIGVSDLAFSGDASNPLNSLSITVTGNPGTITLDRWAGEGRIEEFVFADGTHLTADQVNALAAGETVALDRKPPVVNQPLPDRAIKVDTPFALTVPADVFSDPNPGDTPTLMATLREGRVLPGWLSFDPLTRTFTGTPGSADAGTLTVEVRATDATGFSVKDSFTLTVGDNADQNLVIGTTGDDILVGTTGPDLMAGSAGNDRLSGNDGDDVLIGGAGQDTLDGGAGNDTLITGTGSSTVIGGDGDDTFVINGSDLIDTGAGNNTLWFAANPGGASVVTAGSAGNHYIFSSNFGTVTIGGNGGDATELHPVATFSGYDSTSEFSFGLGSLVIRAEDGSELHLTDFDPNDVYGFTTIGSFRFGDGVELGYAEFIGQGFDIVGSNGNDVLSGTNITDRMDGLGGEDRLSGGSGDDTLTGGRGNDTLQGGDGDDVYVFNLGDGVDTLIDATTDTESNVIRFGEGIVLEDLGLHVDGETLLIEVGAGGDAIQLQHVDPGNGDVTRIVGALAFADGTRTALAELVPLGEGDATILGTADSDLLVGTVDADVIDAGPGDDFVFALGGDDRVFGGGGTDTVFGGHGNDTLSVAGQDQGHVRFFGGAGNDTIAGGPGDDTIRLHRIGGLNSVETIDGAGGVNVLEGTDTADRIDLSPTALANIAHIDARQGDDHVIGTAGSDVILGGQGSDTLSGGGGDDLYRFRRGDGRDRIIEVDGDRYADRLQLGSTIRHDQLWFSRLGDELRIDVIGTRDEIRIMGWYAGSQYQLERLDAGDGYTLSNTRVDQLVQAMAAFTEPPVGEFDLAPELQGYLEPALAAAWEAA